MRTDSSLAIYAADIGSVAKGNFGWSNFSENRESRGRDPSEMVFNIAKDLRGGARIALGFECPLWMDLPDDPAELTKGRVGEGNRAWSAGAGAGALATGIVQTTWILRELRRLSPTAHAYLSWAEFDAVGSGLFLWEAFVSGDAKAVSHTDDAAVAVAAFRDALPYPDAHVAVEPRGPEVLSVIGLALLRSGWTDSPALLSTPSLVLRAAAASHRARKLG